MSANGRKVLTLTCDMPLVSTDLLKELLAHEKFISDACIFEGDQGLEPFPGLYSAQTLRIINQQLHHKNYSMTQFLSRLTRLIRLPAEGSSTEFFNMNTQLDLEELLNHL
jgi:molybdopterin-guanine dinucleotide biosynthesis protein A